MVKGTKQILRRLLPHNVLRTVVTKVLCDGLDVGKSTTKIRPSYIELSPEVGDPELSELRLWGRNDLHRVRAYLDASVRTLLCSGMINSDLALRELESTKILISGTTGLDAWRDPSDLTKMDGGKVYFTVTDLLDAIARIKVRKNSGSPDAGARRRLNLIEGTGIAIGLTDDAVDEEIDMNIAFCSQSVQVSGMSSPIGTNTTNTNYEDMTGSEVSLTLPYNCDVLMMLNGNFRQDGNYSITVIFNYGTVDETNSEITFQERTGGGYYSVIPNTALWLKSNVPSGLHPFKIRWKVSGSKGYISNGRFIVIAVRR